MSEIATRPRAGPRRSPKGRECSRLRSLGLGLLTICATSCASAPPAPATHSLDAVPETPAQSPSVPAAPVTTAPAAGPTPGTPASGLPRLNNRLLSRASPRPNEDPVLGPGDLIEVSVFEVEELSKLKARVPPRESIVLPLIGSIPAAGRTASQIEQDIRARLQQRYMHDPQVSVFVLEHKSQHVSVIGAVRQPGVFPLTGRLQVVDALALAQGLSDDAEPLAYLIRRAPRGDEVRSEASEARFPAAFGQAPGAPTAPGEEMMAAIDLEALVSGREDLNVELRAGDLLSVPRTGSYYIGGSVERPGAAVLRPKMTLDQAIMAAGGVTKLADREDIRIYRDSPEGKREVLTFNLDEVEQGKRAPEVQRNDVIVVGKSTGKSVFYGAMEWLRGIFSVGIGVSRGL